MSRASRYAAMGRALAFCAAFVLCAGGAAGAAHAKGKAAKGAKAPAAGKDDADTKKAKEFFKKGKLYFDSGQFDKALEEYTHAYEAKPLPGFLLNIAQCHRNLEHFDESIFFYKKYLSEVPDSPYRADVEAVIKEMEAKVVEKKAAEAKRMDAARAASSAAEAESAKKRAEAEARSAAAAEEEAKARAAEEEARLKAAREKKPFYQKVWFWGVVGGAVLLAGGATAGGLILFGGGLPETTQGTFDCTTPACMRVGR
ncbi:MAG TPA: hypothetical protein VG389_14965 [Myxococcota bacterium]|nr:hypothetical protein [Myxococcota bacterium]